MVGGSTRAATGDAPLLSVVIPCLNRARLIRRALTSVLSQDFADFEVIVVDDGSTDGSAEAVASYSDPRVRLVRHEVNRGCCPARNTGAAHARGEWVVTFDSDDELLPGALNRMHELAVATPPEISRLVFMHRLDDGSLSPQPPLIDEVWDYETFLRRRERMRRQVELLTCTRRSTFAELRFPDSRAWETAYWYRFGRRFRTRSVGEALLLRHSDAPNRMSGPSPWQLIPEAADQADAIGVVIDEQERDLARLSPALLRRVLVLGVTYSFLAGRRCDGLRYAWRWLRRRPLDLLMWGALPAGLLGPWCYALGLNIVWRLKGAVLR